MICVQGPSYTWLQEESMSLPSCMGAVHKRINGSFGPFAVQRLVVDPSATLWISLPEGQELSSSAEPVVNSGDARPVGWISIVLAGPQPQGFAGNMGSFFVDCILPLNPMLDVLTKPAEFLIGNSVHQSEGGVSKSFPLSFHFFVPKLV